MRTTYMIRNHYKFQNHYISINFCNISKPHSSRFQIFFFTNTQGSFCSLAYKAKSKLFANIMMALPLATQHLPNVGDVHHHDHVHVLLLLLLLHDRAHAHLHDQGLHDAQVLEDQDLHGAQVLEDQDLHGVPRREVGVRDDPDETLS
ncbi:hypothetical protein SO802_010105 [Lithocarpus litseifolius]|uniref:Uncharacterized protein n=1 Tax=Lithocarpus litseifolius TaxID=425828 RepID=A0AAW2DGB3_9ROSI